MFDFDMFAHPVFIAVVVDVFSAIETGVLDTPQQFFDFGNLTLVGDYVPLVLVDFTI
jgi:hypothetical protein